MRKVLAKITRYLIVALAAILYIPLLIIGLLVRLETKLKNK